MNSFQELGKYIDSLIANKDQIKKRSKVAWTQCAPRVFYKCVQLSRQNADQVALWLTETGRFDDVKVTEDGINTKYGEVLWTDWIIQEPHDAVVFIDKDEFEKQYILNG